MTVRRAVASVKKPEQRRSRAARGPVERLTGEADPFEAIRRTVADGDYEEIVISTLPKRVSKWLRRDLPNVLSAPSLRRHDCDGQSERLDTPDPSGNQLPT